MGNLAKFPFIDKMDMTYASVYLLLAAIAQFFLSYYIFPPVKNKRKWLSCFTILVGLYLTACILDIPLKLAKDLSLIGIKALIMNVVVLSIGVIAIEAGCLYKGYRVKCKRETEK